MKKIKRILDELTQKGRFSGREMYDSIHGIVDEYPQTKETLLNIRSKLGETTYRYIMTGLARSVFLIELVNDDISSTKMEVRWTIKESRGKKQEIFDMSDPRFCTFEGCLDIWLKMINDLRSAIGQPEIIELLKLYENFNVISYEIPFDYIYSPITKKSITSIHSAENTYWIWDNKYQMTLKLRAVLLDIKKNNRAEIFGSILKDKTKVKAYLTDRVQTGKHKTNREKRWEVHPESVHFAFRRDCLEIEHTLMCQLCHFEGFPSDLFVILEKEDQLIQAYKETFKCPVTLNNLKFSEFESEVRRPNHGRSNFPVGHLNPLKKPTADPKSGHTAQNISWFSADGNRIQGSLSLEETRDLLHQIWQNYQKK